MLRNRVQFMQQRRAINMGKIDPSQFKRSAASHWLISVLVWVPWLIFASMFLCPQIYVAGRLIGAW